MKQYSMPTGPAYRIETERLVIRCWSPVDAPLLHQAILDSVDHLSPWMDWASEEPKTIGDRVSLLRQFRGEFDLDQDFTYGIFNVDESQVLGGTGLHTRRGKDTREIGYWIHAEHINQGLATECAAALIRVAFEVDQVVRVEIRCDPKNMASAAIPRKLGFSREGVLRQNMKFLGAPRDTEIWGLVAADYPSSPAADVRIRAFDALGQTLLDF